MRRPGFRFSPLPFVMVAVAVALSVCVFVVTQGVQQREARVSDMNHQLLSEQQTLRVLDAEWAYLTRPQRLEELMTMKASRAVPLPMPEAVSNIEPAAGVEKAEVKAVVKEPVPEIIPVAQKPVIVAAPKVLTKMVVKKVRADDLIWSPKRNAAQSVVHTKPVKQRAGVARPIVE